MGTIESKQHSRIRGFKRQTLAILMFAAVSLIATPALFSLPFGHMWVGTHTATPYIGPTIGVSAVDNGAGVWLGLRAGWELDHAIALGVAGNWLMTDLEQEDGSGAAYGYGGLEFRVFLFNAEPISASVDLTMGAGTAGSGVHFMNHRHPDEGDNSDGFLVVEPKFTALVRANQYVRFELSAGYLLTNGATLPGLSDSELSGPRAALAMSFGNWR